MLRGELLSQKMAHLLLHLYEHGAIAPTNAVDATSLQEAVEATDQEFEAIYLNLHQAGKIGGNPYSLLWLTNLGLDEASEIVEQLRKEARDASRRPIGFPTPDETES